MEGSAPPTKKAFTSKPDDTTNEAGSGDDVEDLKLDVTRKPRAKTNRHTVNHHTDNVEEEGSGSGGSGVIDVIQPSMPLSKDLLQPDPTTKPKMASKKIISVTMPVTLKKREETEEPLTKELPMTVRKDMKKPRPVTKLATNQDKVIKPEESKSANDVEWINYSTTGPKTTTTDHPNKIKENTDVIDLGNTAKQHGKNKESRPALSFATGIIIGVVAGVILALLVILFLVYRLRKMDEGPYSLEEPITGYTKQKPGSPTSDILHDDQKE